MRVKAPVSTKGRRASCWALLNRWISSIKRTHGVFWVLEAWLPFSMTFLRSLRPPRTALNWKNGLFFSRAMISARVVLPQPGGPHSTRLGRDPPRRIGYFLSKPVYTFKVFCFFWPHFVRQRSFGQLGGVFGRTVSFGKFLFNLAFTIFK